MAAVKNLLTGKPIEQWQRRDYHFIPSLPPHPHEWPYMIQLYLKPLKVLSARFSFEMSAGVCGW